MLNATIIFASGRIVRAAAVALVATARTGNGDGARGC